MVKFHEVNKILTIGTILFFISLIVFIIGIAFCNDSTLLAYAFLYGGALFVLSVILIFVGVLLRARNGKLQERASDIWNNRGKKN